VCKDDYELSRIFGVTNTQPSLMDWSTLARGNLQTGQFAD